MYGSTQAIQQVPTAVEMTLTDGSVMIGEMFMHAGECVLDIVNNKHRFVPFATFDGPVNVINKDVIARITPIEHHVADDEKIVAIA